MLILGFNSICLIYNLTVIFIAHNSYQYTYFTVKYKLIRVSTVYMSSSILLKGQFNFLKDYFDLTVIFSGNVSEHEKFMQQEGVKTQNINFVRKISIFQDLRSLIQMYLYLKRCKPLIIHSITPKAGLVSMLAARLAGVPIRIHTFTGLIFPYRSGLMKVLLIYMDKLICACATNIYPEGKGVRDDLIKYKVTKKPLNIIGNGNINGVDLDYFNPELFDIPTLDLIKKYHGISTSDFIFIFVGRVVKEKGIDELVSAFSKSFPSSNMRRTIKLIIIGPFEDNGKSLKKSTLNEIYENPNILALGFKEDIRPFLALSDCLVLPSYREGFPNSVIQAGAMGLPSIVTNVSGSNEIIFDGLNGLLIPSKDVFALSNAMLRLVQENETIKKMKMNSRNNIAFRYDQKFVWSLILKEYKVLIEKSKFIL